MSVIHSYSANVNDDEIMTEANGVVGHTSPRKLVIERRRPDTVASRKPLVKSRGNFSIVSGQSGSVVRSLKNSVRYENVSATPRRGPERFIAVNLEKRAGAADLVEQTRLVMKNLENLQKGMSRTNVGCPIKDKEIEVRADRSSTNHDDESVIQKENKGEALASLNDSKIGQPVNARPHRLLDSRSSDLGFAPPVSKIKSKSKPPSEVSFNFKKPVLNSVDPSFGKRKEPPVDLSNTQQELRYLQSWIPRLRNKRLYVEGDLLDMDSSSLGDGNDRRYVSSKIVSRVSSDRVVSKKGTIYVLEGPLVWSEGDKENGCTPNFIIDKFQNGFPASWEKRKPCCDLSWGLLYVSQTPRSS